MSWIRRKKNAHFVCGKVKDIELTNNNLLRIEWNNKVLREKCEKRENSKARRRNSFLKEDESDSSEKSGAFKKYFVLRRQFFLSSRSSVDVEMFMLAKNSHFIIKIIFKKDGNKEHFFPCLTHTFIWNILQFIKYSILTVIVGWFYRNNNVEILSIFSKTWWNIWKMIYIWVQVFEFKCRP